MKTATDKDKRRVLIAVLIADAGGVHPFARMYGLNPRTVQDWNTGTRTPPQGLPELVQRAKAGQEVAETATHLLAFLDRWKFAGGKRMRGDLARAVKRVRALAGVTV